MAVTVEITTPPKPRRSPDAIAMIEHVLPERPGDRRVVIIGSQAKDCWEMKITGPNVFERSYTLEGALG